MEDKLGENAGNPDKKKLLDKNELFDGLIVGDNLPGIRTFWMVLEYIHAHGRRPRLMEIYLFLVVVYSITYMGGCLLAVILVEMEYKRRLAALMNPICGLQSLFKNWIFNRDVDKYVDLMQFIKRDFLTSIPEEKKDGTYYYVIGARDVYNKNTEATNRYTKYALAWNLLTLGMVSTMPYIRSQWLRETLHVGQGPLVPNKVTEVEYVFEWNYSPVYEMIFLYEEGAVLLAVFSAFVYQGYLILSLMALVGHAKALGYVLEDLKGTDFSRSDRLNAAEQEKAYQTLLACIKDHQKLVRAGDTLADRYNLFLTFHLSTAIIVGVIAIFELTLSENFSDCFKFFVMVGYSLLEVAIYCMCGQLLENASEELYRQVYQCEWEVMSPKFRKAASLLMLRANHPLCLRAGRLYQVNLETLANIQQLVYTCLTMLTNSSD